MKYFTFLCTNTFTNQYTTNKHLKILRAFTYEPVWQSSTHHTDVCQIAKAFRKISIVSICFVDIFEWRALIIFWIVKIFSLFYLCCQGVLDKGILQKCQRQCSRYMRNYSNGNGPRQSIPYSHLYPLDHSRPGTENWK